MISDEVFVVPMLQRDINSSYKFLVYSDKNNFVICGLDELLKREGTFVCLDFAEAMLECKIEKIPSNILIIDLKSLGKYFFGHPAKEFKKELPWEIFKMLEDYYRQEDELVSVCRKIKGLKIKCEISNDDLSKFVERIANKYFEIKKALIGRGDWDRFELVEVPVYQVFLDRTLRGIKIDLEKIEDYISKIETEHYSMLSDLRNKFLYSAADISNGSIIEFLIRTDKLNLSDEDDFDLFNFLKAREHLTEEYFLLMNLLKNKKTKKSLLNLLLFVGDRTHPIFDISGTVTSRILVREPNLQTLRKECRDILIPDQGMEFLYIDFSCFEPSIMADIAGDLDLIGLCNSGDMYTKISERAGFGKENRKLFKIFFLAYSFGMDRENLQSFMAELLNIEHIQAVKMYSDIFGEFKTLASWKALIWKQTLSEGFSESIFGNRRYRKKNQALLKQSEMRWAINQVIQGSASLIVKKAILKIKATYGDKLEILLPMHDAILFQGDAGFISEKREEISSVMKSAYSDYFKKVKIGTSIEPFYSS